MTATGPRPVVVSSGDAATTGDGRRRMTSQPPPRRRYGYGVRIGRMTNGDNVANLLMQSSTEMARASMLYRRSRGEEYAERRETLEQGKSVARMAVKFSLEALAEEGEDLHEVVREFLESQCEQDE